MSRRVPPDLVDLSRRARLVHDARSSGRNVIVTAYIEGLVGDSDRYAIESSIMCRTSEQAAELARVIRDASGPAAGERGAGR